MPNQSICDRARMMAMAMTMATSCSKTCHPGVATRRRQRAVMGMWLLALATSTRIPMTIAYGPNSHDGRRDDEIHVPCRCPYPEEPNALNIFQRKKRKGRPQYDYDGEDIDAADYVISTDGDRLIPDDHPSCRYIEFVCPGENATFPIWDYTCLIPKEASVLVSPSSQGSNVSTMASSKAAGQMKKKKDHRRSRPPRDFPPSVSVIPQPSSSPTLTASLKSLKTQKRKRRRRPPPSGSPAGELTATLEPRSPKRKRRRPPRELKHTKSDEVSVNETMDPEAANTLSPGLGATSDNIFRREEVGPKKDTRKGNDENPNNRGRKGGNRVENGSSYPDGDVEGIDSPELSRKRKDNNSSTKAPRKSTKSKTVISAAPTVQSSSNIAPVKPPSTTPTVDSSSTVTPVHSPSDAATSSPISSMPISSKRVKQKSIKGMMSKDTKRRDSLPLTSKSDTSRAPSTDDTSPPNLRATNSPSTSLPGKRAKEMGQKKIKLKKQQQDTDENSMNVAASKSTKKKKRDQHSTNFLGGNVTDTVLFSNSRKKKKNKYSSGISDNSNNITASSTSSKVRKKRPRTDGTETTSSKEMLPWKTVVLPLSSPLCGSANTAPAPIVQTDNPVAEMPVAVPVALPMETPSEIPSTEPTFFPITFLPTGSANPSQSPSFVPVIPIMSAVPEATSHQPTLQPMTISPTAQPVLLIVSISESPSSQPVIPIAQTDEMPTDQPNARVPEVDLQEAPTPLPSPTPTIWTWSPSPSPWPFGPSHAPSEIPSTEIVTTDPTISPTIKPTAHPSQKPSRQPTVEPSISLSPSTEPTQKPTISTSSSPTTRTTEAPSTAPIVASSIPPSKPSVKPSLDPTAIPSSEPSVSNVIGFLFKDWLPWTDKPSISPSTSDSPSQSPSVFPGLVASALVDRSSYTKRSANIFEAQSLPNPTGLSNPRQGPPSDQETSSASDSSSAPSMLEAMMTIVRPSSMPDGINKSISPQETPEQAQNVGGVLDVFRQPGHRRKLRGDVSESDFVNSEQSHYS